MDHGRTELEGQQVLEEEEERVWLGGIWLGRLRKDYLLQKGQEKSWNRLGWGFLEKDQLLKN